METIKKFSSGLFSTLSSREEPSPQEISDILSGPAAQRQDRNDLPARPLKRKATADSVVMGGREAQDSLAHSGSPAKRLRSTKSLRKPNVTTRSSKAELFSYEIPQSPEKDETGVQQPMDGFSYDFSKTLAFNKSRIQALADKKIPGQERDQEKRDLKKKTIRSQRPRESAFRLDHETFTPVGSDVSARPSQNTRSRNLRPQSQTPSPGKTKKSLVPAVEVSHPTPQTKQMAKADQAATGSIYRLAIPGTRDQSKSKRVRSESALQKRKGRTATEENSATTFHLPSVPSESEFEIEEENSSDDEDGQTEEIGTEVQSTGDEEDNSDEGGETSDYGEVINDDIVEEEEVNGNEEVASNDEEEAGSDGQDSDQNSERKISRQGRQRSSQPSPEIEYQRILPGTDADEGNAADDEEDTPLELDSAVNIHGCGELWQTALTAAHKTLASRSEQDSGDLESSPARKFARAIKVYEQQVQSDEPSNSKTLAKITMLATDKLKASRLHTRDDDYTLVKEIHLFVIPRGLGLIYSTLCVRARDGRLNTNALQELHTLIKAILVLCERVKLWKVNGAISRNDMRRTVEIRKALGLIGNAYAEKVSLTKEREHARRQRQAYEEGVLIEKQERQDAILRQQRLADAFIQRKLDEARARTIRQAVPQTSYNNDDDDDDGGIYNDDIYDADEAPKYLREPTEDIPEPTSRVWQREETAALLFLLQAHRGKDRFDEIHQELSDISRQMRQVGVETFLQDGVFGLYQVDDVLDDLGVVEVEEIQHHAAYLRAVQAPQIDSYIEQTGDTGRWEWLTSVESR